MISNSFDVLLVQRSDTSSYPPTINQANLLAESGLRVVLIDGGKNAEQRPSLDTRVKLIRPLVNTSSCRLDNFRFISACRRALKYCSGVSVAYDSQAACILGMLPFGGRKIFHFHEYPGDSTVSLSRYAAFKLRLYDKIAIYFSRKVACVSMPDSHRASAFYKENALPCRPLVINNCPRTIERLEHGALRSYLASLGINRKYLLLFQGSVSLPYYVDHIVRSMHLWPRDSLMVFIGGVAPHVRRQLDDIAHEMGVSERIIFLGTIPYPKLLTFTVDADIAFCMVRPLSFNTMHCAGASNKRYEAIACGVPQVANTGPGMYELLEGAGIGICVNADLPDEIGQAVKSLIENVELRRAMGVRARNLHLGTLNYQTEFAPMLQKIALWCNESQ